MNNKIIALSIAAVFMLSCNHSAQEAKIKDTALSLDDKQDIIALEKEFDDLYDLDDWGDEDFATVNSSDSILDDDIAVSGKSMEGTTYMDRKMKIVNLKREMGMKMKAIGMNRNLSGYEKGMRKRAMKMQYLQELHKILGENPAAAGITKSNVDFSSINKLTYDIDMKLDELEDKYDAEKDKLEAQEDYMLKTEYKARKNALKTKYKQKKEVLKRKRNEIIYNEMYD